MYIGANLGFKVEVHLHIRKDYEKMAKIVIIIFFLQFFTGIHVEYLKFHNLDAGKTYQCF